VAAPPRRTEHAGITHISVQGFKSLRTRQEIAIRPLTIFAGINSSGKSSAMQPLLLLKQTLEAGYDPGPLQLDGPNVSVTAIDQVLSKTHTKAKQVRSFTVGITVGDRTTELTYGKDRKGDLRVLEMSAAFFPDQPRPLRLREGMTDAQLRELVPDWFLTLGTLPQMAQLPGRPAEPRLGVWRDRAFLVPAWKTAGSISRLAAPAELESELSRIIHLPALRGNPRRTYRTAAVEDRYPGTFEAYTAGVIAAWQHNNRKDELEQLRADLEHLGLTRKIEARQLDDTRVQLLVGRIPDARPGAAEDLVNIADVGFGVSQTLPVTVALGAAQPHQLVYLEQPEIHLHPRAQFKFGHVVRTALRRNVRIVVETHSALFVRSIQTLVAQGELRPSDVALHWFTRDPRTGDTHISTGDLDEAGAFGDWPEDFDEIQLAAETAYLDAAAARAPRE
jgi:hypothetical protein